MAKVQTRRAISINRSLYDRLIEYGRANCVPAAQLAEQGIAAILDGRLERQPANSDVEYRDGRWRQPKPAPPPARRKTEKIVVHGPGEFCALCTADVVGKPLRRAPLGRDNALVNVCERCDEESPRLGRYGFDDGGVRSRGEYGVGEGNKRAKARGVNGG